MVVLFECAGVDSVALGPVRAITATTLLCAVYVAGVLTDRMPLTAFVARTALAAAVIAALVAPFSGAIDDVEWVGVPVAAALLITGARRLALEPPARSWPALGAGLAVLLLPALAATLGDRPVWRLVAIGVVAMAALMHGTATFAPQIRAGYEHRVGGVSGPRRRRHHGARRTLRTQSQRGAQRREGHRRASIALERYSSRSRR